MPMQNYVKRFCQAICNEEDEGKAKKECSTLDGFHTVVHHSPTVISGLGLRCVIAQVPCMYSCTSPQC